MDISQLKEKGYRAQRESGWINGQLVYTWVIYSPEGQDTGAYGKTEEDAWWEFAWSEV